MKIPNRPGTLEVCESAAAVAERAAEQFVSLAKACAALSGRFTVALSGGSTPKAIYELLAAPRYREQVPWDRVHLFWGDERAVPPDHAESNYRMTREALLEKVPVVTSQVHRIEAEREPAAAAAAYEAILKAELGASPRFDLVWLGMGDDGHTASLFPGTTALAETERLVAAPYVEKFKTHRITLTAPVINNAAQISFLITGAGKAQTLKEVLTGAIETNRLPSQLIQPTTGELLWLVDQAAAGQLSFLSD